MGQTRQEAANIFLLLLLLLPPLVEQPLRPRILEELVVVDEAVQLRNAATQPPVVAQAATQSRVHPADHCRILHPNPV